MNKLTFQGPSCYGLGRATHRIRSTVFGLVALAGLTFTHTTSLYAADPTADPKEVTTTTPPPPKPDMPLGSRFSGLINFDFSDKYYTPRGLMSSNHGVSFQPLLILFLNLYSSDKGPLTDLSFNMGVWNDLDTSANKSEKNPGTWNEIDGFFGMEAKLYKDWKIDAEETFFRSQTQSYDTTTNFTLQATYNDHWFGDSGFSINPYAAMFFNTSKIPVVLGSNNGFYGTIGMDPTYKFKTLPLTLELPTFVNIVSAGFYETYTGAPGGAGAAVISTALKASTPLKFIPISYGAWTAYASVQYYHYDNNGLEDGNRILLSQSPSHAATTNTMQFHWGMSCFF